MKSKIIKQRWLMAIPLLCLMILQSGTASSQQLFKYADNPRLSEKQQHYADAWIKKDWVRSYKYITIDPALFKEISVSINLPGREGNLTAAQNEIIDHEGGMVSWKSRFTGMLGNADFVINKDMITARISSAKFTYLVYPLSEGLHVLLECSSVNFPPDESTLGYQQMLEQGRKSEAAAAVPHTDPEAGPDGSNKAQSGDCKVRILVAYTSTTKANMADVKAFVVSCIDATNTAYNNSLVNFNVELAVSIEEAYTESLNSATDKVRFHDTNDGYMDDVHDYRTYFDADMCVLITENLQSGICGEAYTVANSTYTDPFCVVTRGCAVGNLSFPHELGHLYGCRHDTYVDGTTTPYAYGHGYIYLPGSWRTVMAYNNYCSDNGGSCTRLQYFSNPGVTYGGVAMGTNATNDNESALEASRANISSLEATLSAKVFTNAYTFTSGEQSDVIATSSITNNTTFALQSGSKGTWRSGGSSTLAPGFRAYAGSYFRAYQDACVTLTKMSPQGDILAKKTAANSVADMEGVQVYPNPFVSNFQLAINTTKADEKAQIRVYNSLGLKVMEKTGISLSKGMSKIDFDGSRLSSGMYMIEIWTGDKKTVKKIVKD